MRLIRKPIGPLALLLAVCGVLVLGSSACAARIIRIEIMLDGRVILEAHTEGDGDADAVWRYMSQPTTTFKSVNTYVVKPDVTKPEQATLKGRVRINCRYSGTCTVSELKLIRDKKKDPDKWRIDPSEVERTLKIREKTR